MLTIGAVHRLYCCHFDLQERRPDHEFGPLRYGQGQEMCVKHVQLNWKAPETDSIPGYPISLLLVGMIYTSTKSLQFLSVPVYTIFKNLTIIVIAYGEVLWFGGEVTPIALLSFGLMVLSSIIAAWADIQAALSGQHDASVSVSTLNAGYAWMGMNVFCTASYVLTMRKVIKKMNFKDWDCMWTPAMIVTGAKVDFSQRCFTTTCLPSPRSSLLPSSLRTGAPRTSTSTSRRSPATR